MKEEECANLKNLVHDLESMFFNLVFCHIIVQSLSIFLCIFQIIFLNLTLMNSIFREGSSRCGWRH